MDVVPPDDEQLLAVIAALGCDRPDAIAAAGAAVGRPDALGVLTRSDGAVVSGDHVRLPRQTGDPEPDVVAVAAGAAGAVLLEAGDLEGAGRVAMAADHAELMRATVRATLRVQPPLLPTPVLRAWRERGVLADDDSYARWLDAACRGAGGAPPLEVADAYDAVRRAFADDGDLEAEISVGLAEAVHARRAEDLLRLVALAQRAEDLVAAGHDEALAPAVLGRTLRHQIEGDPAAALASLEDFPDDRLVGDWAAQVSMIRGTNLILLGRHDEALAALRLAAGHGSDWTYAVAIEVTGTARWCGGDAVGAVEDLQWSEFVARRTGALPVAELAVCHRAVLEAALGWPEAEATARQIDEMIVGAEGLRLLSVAAVFRAAAAGDVESARDLAVGLPQPGRATRSAHWIVALRAALAGPDADLAALAGAHPSLAAALDAGHAASAHLAGGPLAPASMRYLLPSVWCETVPATVDLRLTGDASVRIDGRRVEHPYWDRPRVRELCLHLALFTDCARGMVAFHLWPDRDAARADGNLRVTLSYLSDVLDPDHPKGTRTPLIHEWAGMLSLADTSRLRVDVRLAETAAEQVIAAVALGDDVGLVRSARDLVRLPAGQLLGGAIAPDWMEQRDGARRELLLRAASCGAPLLARLGLHDLAETMARRGLDQDPWAERLYQTIVRCRLAVDDLDGARRAMREGLAALADLAAEPEPATVDLAASVGLSI